MELKTNTFEIDKLISRDFELKVLSEQQVERIIREKLNGKAKKDLVITTEPKQDKII